MQIPAMAHEMYYYLFRTLFFRTLVFRISKVKKSFMLNLYKHQRQFMERIIIENILTYFQTKIFFKLSKTLYQDLQ